MKKLLSVLFLLAFFDLQAQQTSDNLIIVTLDGMRWQEIFKGADDSILGNKNFTKDPEGTKQRFWDKDPMTRREKLFPFLWHTIKDGGRIYGNRDLGNLVNVSNKYWFSYPGYNEIFTGFPDDSVNSNDRIWNPNQNVLEFLNEQPLFKSKIAAFSTWDVFPYILNRQRSGLMINADADSLPATTENFKLLNDLQKLAPRPIGVRPDVITYLMAREYIRVNKPKVVYIAFDETDDLAHGGMYDQYLRSANAEDAMMADLWDLLNKMDEYKGKTTIMITCDHGRGDVKKEDWRHHGVDIPGADQIWLAVMGPGIRPEGEVKRPVQLYQKQLASTFARILGYDFKASHPVADPLNDLFR